MRVSRSPWATPCRGVALCFGAIAIAALSTFSASAEERQAQAILKSMSDYLGGQENLYLKYDSDVEAITPAIEKLLFSASGELTLSRPNRFRVSRTGGYADVELVSDGSQVTVYDRDGNRFAQVPGGGSFEEVVDRLRGETALDLPGADLLLPKSYDELMSGVIEAKYIGRGVVEGVECEHLAFRNLETDWQIWIEVGDKPWPRKYVVTSKTVGGAPQYMLRLREWKAAASPATDAFAFRPATGASGVAISLLKNLDEIPAGEIPGGKK